MGKRATKRRQANQSSNNVETLYGGPINQHEDKQRAQSYVKNVRPRTPGQKELMKVMKENCLTFAIGPAGTGKTYLAVAEAVKQFDAGTVNKILLARPAVEAGESLGFLPGDIAQKMDPYMRPLYDALLDRMGAKRLRTHMEDGSIEITPVGHQRGRTHSNSFVLLDEAQNCTYSQLKMFVTRLGFNSTLVITGDPNQSDLPAGQSGLENMLNRVKNLEGIGHCELFDKDVVRHPLVASMIKVL